MIKKDISLRFLLKLLGGFVTIVLAGLYIWQFNLKKIHEEHKRDVAALIQNIIKLSAKNSKGVPELVILNNGNKEVLSPELMHRVAATLTETYLANDTLTFASLDLQPLVDLSGKQDKRGNVYLTEAQLSGLKLHMDFLAKQFDIQVANLKEEFARDIERLNLWVTIWIGVIAVLGIFVPVLINADATRKAELADEKSGKAAFKSEEARKTAEGAINAINAYKVHIDKIPEIESGISKAEQRLNTISSTAGTAQRAAAEAERMANIAHVKSSLLHLAQAIDRLKQIDPQNLKLLEQEKKIPYFKNTLMNIERCMNECNDYCVDNSMTVYMADLALQLSRITLLKFISMRNTEAINAFANDIYDALKGDYTEEEHKKLAGKLKYLYATLEQAEPLN